MEGVEADASVATIVGVELPAETLEYVLVDVEAWDSGYKIDPTAATVEFAFLNNDDDRPDDNAGWVTGDWEQANRSYFARCLIGPGSPSGVVLVAGTTRYVWVRITNDPERPVKYSGTIEVV